MSITTQEMDASRAKNEQKQAKKAHTPTHTHKLITTFLSKNDTKAFKIEEIQNEINEMAARLGLLARGIADTTLSTEGLVKSGLVKSYAGHYAINNEGRADRTEARLAPLPSTEPAGTPSFSGKTIEVSKKYDSANDALAAIERFERLNLPYCGLTQAIVGYSGRRRIDLRKHIEHLASLAGGITRIKNTSVFLRGKRVHFIRSGAADDVLNILQVAAHQESQSLPSSDGTSATHQPKKQFLDAANKVIEHVLQNKKPVSLGRLLNDLMPNLVKDARLVAEEIMRNLPRGIGIVEIGNYYRNRRKYFVGPVGSEIQTRTFGIKNLVRLHATRILMNEGSWNRSASSDPAEQAKAFKEELMPKVNAYLAQNRDQITRDILTGKTVVLIRSKTVIIPSGYAFAGKFTRGLFEKKMVPAILSKNSQPKTATVDKIRIAVPQAVPLGDMQASKVERTSVETIPNLVTSYYAGFGNKEAVQRVLGNLAYFGRVTSVEFNKDYGQDKWEGFVMRTLTCVDAVEIALSVPKGSVQFRNGELVCNKSILPS